MGPRLPLSRIPCFSIFAVNIFFWLACTWTAAGQNLIFQAAYLDGSGGVDGLNGSYGVALSPDNAFLYTASSTDDAVAVFSLDGIGGVTFVEVHKDDEQTGGTIDGLRDAKRLTVSPDGNHVYVPASNDDAVVVFSRNAVTGALTYVETQRDGVSGVDGLNGAHQVIVSPDNNHVYVAGYVDDAIAVFSRNTSTGALTYVEIQKDGVSGVDGLNNVRGIAFSTDGNFIYVASATDDAVAVFSRNSVTGALTYVENHKDGISGVDGLNGAYGLMVSPDNNHLYVASYNDDAVAVFSRNTVTGALTFLEVHKDDSQTGGAIDGLNAARMVAVSPDSTTVYAVASSDHSIVVFDRDLSTGLLTYSATYADAVDGVDGINGVRYLAVPSDHALVYTVSTGDDALTSFSNGTILPVAMGAISGFSDEKGKVIIRWTGASDTDVESYVVERKEKAGSFASVGLVNADGYEPEARAYQVIDQTPGPGRYYYRVIRRSVNGESSYSNTIEVVVNPASHTCDLIIAPNPVQSSSVIELSGCNVLDHAEAEIEIWDVSGKQIASHKGKMLLGKLDLFDPETSPARPGIYWVTIRIGDAYWVEKVVVRP